MTAEPPLSPRARSELERLLHEADREIAATAATCWLRGECCDFERVDHILFASSVEIGFVRDKHPEPFPGGSVHCPFWQEGRCVERERRPLGCRTYFCDPTDRERLEAIYERYHAAIRDLARRHGVEYRYQPFVRALRSGSSDAHRAD